MDLKNQNGADVQENVSAKEGLNGQVKTNHVKKAGAQATESSAKTNGKPDPVAPDAGKVNGVQVPPEALPQAAEAVKPVRLALNLEGTLKVVEDLHRRSIQRVNLIARMKQLEAFEVNLAAENDELEENPYQGCKLIIEDDKARRFITTTPGLIRMVAQYIFDACGEKLADIEAHIVLPNA